jgi:hypothetical protein
MRDLLLSMIRRRARMGQESRPRPDDGFERVVMDSSDEIIIDGVPIGAANVDADRGSGNPLKFMLWIVVIFILSTAALGYWKTLPERIDDFFDDLLQPSTSMPRLPDTGLPESPGAAPAGSGQSDAVPDEPRSKKNTY